MNKENRAIIEMLLCATLWSIGGIFIKQVPWNGFAVACVRAFIASITFATYMLIARHRFIFTKETVISGVLTGCVSVCFAVANKLTTAANAIVLQFTAPVFIVIFSTVFLKQKIKRNDLYVVIATLIGIALFFFDQLQPGYILGNFIAIAAGMFMACMFMTVGNLEGDKRFSAVFIGQCFTCLVGLPFFIATKPEFTYTATVSLIILGVFQIGIAYILYVRSSRYCPPLACSLLSALEPLLNPVWVFLFDGERPGLFALIGAVIVVVSITVWCIVGQGQNENSAVNEA